MKTKTVAKLLLGMPRNPPKIGDALKSFLSGNPCKDVRCAFVYVSLAGLTESVGSLFERDEYQKLKKKWVVGIHNGITEPAAIEALLEFPNSKVRIYSPTGNISKAALLGAEKLHSKVIFLSGSTKCFFVVGSTNLTRAAIGIQSSNYEAGASIKTGSSIPEKIFNTWFNSIWDESIGASVTVVNKYSKIREEFLRENKIIVPQLDEIPASSVGMRKHLWIEAGAMSGGARNQVEFGPTLASFFGNPVRGTVYLRIRWDGIVREDRPLSYKVTEWNTEIWRLSMITSSQGGPFYPDQIIHFTRMRDRGGEYFVVDVAPPNSAKARFWRRQASRKGTFAMTGLGTGLAREYGVY